MTGQITLRVRAPTRSFNHFQYPTYREPQQEALSQADGQTLSCTRKEITHTHAQPSSQHVNARTKPGYCTGPHADAEGLIECAPPLTVFTYTRRERQDESSCKFERQHERSEINSMIIPQSLTMRCSLRGCDFTALLLWELLPTEKQTDAFGNQ